jgi:GntR family transcriptional regulator/MocR family aminotransferase
VDLHVSLVGRKDLSGEIYRQLRSAMRDGRLRPGDRLPPTRDLAKQLDVARMTVIVAYDRLVGEGYVTSRIGAGTFVNPSVTTAISPTGRGRTAGSLRARPVWGLLRSSTAVAQPAFVRPARFDFRSGLPDASLFPHEIWRRLVARELRADTVGTAVYGEPRGHLRLRYAIARHIAVSRGVEASADDVTITNGTQQALDIVARLLLEPGDRVAVEAPGYAPARLLFMSAGFRVVGVPVDLGGLMVDALPRGARLVYVTPSHQYPLGVSMTLARRLALLTWADRNHAAIVEDDYDSEFRFHGRPIETLHALDTSGRVIYMGSFSKTMLPTLRLGFVVTPPSLRGAVGIAKFVTDWHTPLPLQAALAGFIESGDFARHLRRMRTKYEERHDTISRLLARDFADHLSPMPSVAGLHLAALCRMLSADQLRAVVARASDDGVEVQELSRFAVDGVKTRAGLVLGYGAIPTNRIAEGLRLLRRQFGAAAAASVGRSRA